MASPVIALLAVQLCFSGRCWFAENTAGKYNGFVYIESRTPRSLAFLEDWLPYGLFPYVNGLMIDGGPRLESEVIERMSTRRVLQHVEILDRTLAPGTGRTLGTIDGLERIVLIRRHVDAADLEELMQAPDLTDLSIHGSTITGDLSAAFREAGKLRTLGLTGPGWNTAGLSAIPSENHLEILALIDSGARDKDIPDLPHVEFLNLTGTNVDGTFLRSATLGATLDDIRLNQTAAGDEALGLLGARPTPPRLVQMARTQVSDAGVQAFVDRLQKSRPVWLPGEGHTLDLTECPLVTDKSLDTTALSSCIEWVGVCSTSVTDEGIQRALRVRPKLHLMECGSTSKPYWMLR